MEDTRARLGMIRKFIGDCGYAGELLKADEFDILAFTVSNITTGYDGMEPEVTIAFSDCLINTGQLDCDILQIYAAIGFTVPMERLTQIQLFCSDVNKIIQIGYFGTDFEEKTCFYEYAQPVSKNITEEEMRKLCDGIITQILLYLALFYDIFLDLVFGEIGYEAAAVAVKEKSEKLQTAIADIYADRSDDDEIEAPL